MSFKTLKTTILLTLTVIAALSCKKEEESTVLPYLSGTVTISGIEDFVDASSTASRTLKLKPSGVTHPEGKGVGYCW